MRFGAAVTLVLSCFNSGAQEALPEAQVKSVFLFNFCHFVEWPQNAFESPGSPFVIGLFGDDPVNEFVDEAIAGEVVDGHPLSAKKITSPNEISKCHILYVGSADEAEMQKLLPHMKNKNILTVGDHAEFLKQGGIIRFHKVDNRIRIQVNAEALDNTNLVMSAKLLRLADIY